MYKRFICYYKILEKNGLLYEYRLLNVKCLQLKYFTLKTKDKLISYYNNAGNVEQRAEWTFECKRKTYVEERVCVCLCCPHLQRRFVVPTFGNRLETLLYKLKIDLALLLVFIFIIMKDNIRNSLREPSNYNSLKLWTNIVSCFSLE